MKDKKQILELLEERFNKNPQRPQRKTWKK